MTNEIMTPEKWNDLCSEAASQMRSHVLPFLTPISRALSDEYGEQHGSGSYIQADGGVFLITNEHVACRSGGYPLTHQFWNSENVYRVQHSWASERYPVDVAACRIDDPVWIHDNHDALGIPIRRFAETHAPEDRELLFFAGYSGDRSKFLFGHLFAPGTPYLTQKIATPDDVPEANDEYHFALPYNPARAVSVDGSSELPTPPGFSGSLVWDTKRVACLQRGMQWTPEMAEVTGIVWGWPSSEGCILATKVEHIELHDLLAKAERQA